MIDFNRLSVSLEELISKKKYTQYVELLQTSFQQASTTQDVDNLLVLLFKIELEHKIYTLQFLSNQYKTFLLFVKKVICELLSQGVIPHKEYLHLYNIFSHFDFNEDNNIVTLLDFFKNDIKTLPWDSEDKLTENNIILLLEIMNGSKKEALLQYIKNILLTNIHVGQNGLHCQFINGFSTSTDHFTIDLLIEAMNYYLNSIVYNKLSLNEKKSLFAWGYELFLNNTKFTKNSKVTELYTPLKKLIQIHVEKDEIEELMYIEFFTMISQFTVYQQNEESEKFNQEITYPAGKAYEKFSIDNNLIQPKRYDNKKKKVAFIFERLVEHSPFKVVFSLLKELQRNTDFTDNYEIELYSLNYFLPLYNVQEIENSLTEIGIKVIYPSKTYLELDNYSNRLERALNIKEKIIRNQVDIMIACFNSYDILNFLFASRTANKQIYWSHGNDMYSVNNIDIYLTHMNTTISHYKTFRVNSSMPIGNKEEKEEGEKIKTSLLNKYGENTVILGTIGRLLKIDQDDYINIISTVLKLNPNTVYIACGSGNTLNLEKKIKEYNIDPSRFIFAGQINPNVYGWVLDIWADTFPLRQGLSTGEFLAKRKAFVTHGNYYTKEHLKRFKKKYSDVDPLPLVFSEKEYIERLNLIITNKEYYKKLANLAYNDANNAIIEINEFRRIIEC